MSRELQRNPSEELQILRAEKLEWENQKAQLMLEQEAMLSAAGADTTAHEQQLVESLNAQNAELVRVQKMLLETKSRLKQEKKKVGTQGLQH